ncbi:MAG: endospore germination permease [Clostridia bacterium]|nr:endospore germination permease [Clostridia bacterium]
MQFGIVYLISKLLGKFPRLDIVDISNFLGGKWLKFTIGILFILYFIFTISILLRSFSEGLKIIFFPRTSVPVIMLLFLIAIVISSKLGFQAISRSNLFIIGFVLFTLFFIFFANIQNFTFQGMLPLLGEGVQSTFFAGLSNLFAFGGISYLYFLSPYLKDEKSYRKVALISTGMSGICLLISVATLLFLSPTTIIQEEIFPIYLASRYIEFGRFFQRLDAVFLLIWIISITSFLSISFCFTTKIFQKLFRLQYSKWYISLFSIIIFGVGLLPKDMYQIIFLENTVYQYIILILVLAISLSLLVFANIKYNKLEKKKGVVSIDKASL